MSGSDFDMFKQYTNMALSLSAMGLAKDFLESHISLPENGVSFNDLERELTLEKFRKLGVNFSTAPDNDIPHEVSSIGSFVADLFTSYLNDVFRIGSTNFPSFDRRLELDEQMGIANFDKQKLFDSFSKTFVRGVCEFFTKLGDSSTSLSQLMIVLGRGLSSPENHLQALFKKAEYAFAVIAQRVSIAGLQEIRALLREELGVDLDSTLYPDFTLYDPLRSIPERDN